jgi:anti-sigma B factor antagonist
VSAAGDFDVRIDSLPAGGVVVKVFGELDLATTPKLEDALASNGSALPLVLDLSECTLVDSSGVRALVNTAREARDAGHRLAVVADDPGILRVLEITGVDELMTVHPTLDAAL